MIDRELYLPRSWAEEKGRWKQAIVPEEVIYQRRAELALKMLSRAFDEGVKLPWVVAGSCYGSEDALHRSLETCEQSYVLALRSNVYLWELAGQEGKGDEERPRQIDVAEPIGRPAIGEREHLSACDGANDLRLFDWALVMIERLLPAASGLGSWSGAASHIRPSWRRSLTATCSVPWRRAFPRWYGFPGCA